MFKALLIEKHDDDSVTIGVKDMDEAQLPEGNVSVDVEYTTINFKDGLFLDPKGGRLRQFPHVAGIDFSGTVSASEDARYAVGDKVLLTGWRVGETHFGGFAQKARVNADWLVPLPDGMTTRQAMAVGTAGFTAMLAVMALEDHGLKPDQGPVLVTGAAGGVGSVATAILAKLGYEVAAVTGRPEVADYLRDLGASRIVAREELSEPAGRPMEKEVWAGCVEAVGSTTLSRVLGQMKYGASVATIGLAGGVDLNTTVMPFILRGVNLLGIESVMQPYENRLRAWGRISSDLPMDKLEAMIRPAVLADLPGLGRDILAGKVKGRVVVDVNG
ncbi:MAG: MDR family oxidoreductase [Paracoccaceae bacterium]